MPTLSNSLNPAPVVAPTGGISNGTFRLIQSRLLFFADGAAETVTAAGYWKEKVVKAAPKATGATWAKGQALFWDGTSKFQTTAVTGKTLPQAIAASDQASGDATGDVELTGLPYV